MRRTRPSRASLRGARLQRRNPRPESLQRRRHPVEAPFDEVTARLPGDDGDDQARFLEAVISTKRGVVRVASIYLPNGNPPDTEKYSYKIKWMDRLIDYAHERLALEEPLVLAGDYNVIPTRRRRPQSGGLGRATRCSCRRPARASAR